MKKIITKTSWAMLCLALCAIVLPSCAKYQNNRSDKQIQEYFTKNNIVNATKTTSGLYYTTDVAGGTDRPTDASIITMHYEGRLLNDSIFDSSYSAGFPASFSPTAVVQGFGEGVKLFGRGGKGTLYIPSTLAYGNTKKASQKKGFASIPKNSVLVFKIDIIDF
jgi:FKBP-type peptidyl-prolyl cis-trans isomerase